MINKDKAITEGERYLVEYNSRSRTYHVMGEWLWIMGYNCGSYDRVSLCKQFKSHSDPESSQNKGPVFALTEEELDGSVISKDYNAGTFCSLCQSHF